MTLVPPFKVLGSFEGGGLGQLLKCEDANGKRFAAKFPKDRAYESQQLILDEERRFWRHQGTYVVEYYGTIHHADGRRGFAMELMEGSLSGLVLSEKSLTRSQIITYFSHAAIGLAEVHRSAHGTFHGDMKLANTLGEEWRRQAGGLWSRPRWSRADSDARTSRRWNSRVLPARRLLFREWRHLLARRDAVGSAGSPRAAE